MAKLIQAAIDRPVRSGRAEASQQREWGRTELDRFIKSSHHWLKEKPRPSDHRPVR